LSGALRAAGYRVLCRSRNQDVRIERKAWVIGLYQWPLNPLIFERDPKPHLFSLFNRGLDIVLQVQDRIDDLGLTEAEKALMGVIRAFRERADRAP
jgi:hypothetical protein